jgi:hypothetical protein
MVLISKSQILTSSVINITMITFCKPLLCWNKKNDKFNTKQVKEGKFILSSNSYLIKDLFKREIMLSTRLLLISVIVKA